MKKIISKEFNAKLKEIGLSNNYEEIKNIPFLEVYHYHNWDHGYESNYGYNGRRRAFYSDMREIVDFLYSYIYYHKITEFIVTPWYDYDQFVNNAIYYENCMDIYEEISIFLKKNKIRRRSRTSVEISMKGNTEFIEMILEGAFRGISNLRIFFRDNGVMVDPNHHFGITFWTQNYLEESRVIKELLKNHSSLRFYGSLD